MASAAAPFTVSGAVSGFLAKQAAPVAQVKARSGAADDAAAEATDEALFGDALSGNRDALGLLVLRYEKSLFSLLARMTGGDTHKADDLFQETFLHAMRASGTFNRKLQFKPWVTAIAVNLVRDDARKRKVRGEVSLDRGNGDDGAERLPEPAASGENPSDSAERRDDEEHIQRSLQCLTALEREVVLLHFFNNMTLVETSESLSVPLGTVKSRLHAGLMRLSGLLASRDGTAGGTPAVQVKEE